MPRPWSVLLPPGKLYQAQTSANSTFSSSITKPPGHASSSSITPSLCLRRRDSPFDQGGAVSTVSLTQLPSPTGLSSYAVCTRNIPKLNTGSWKWCKILLHIIYIYIYHYICVYIFKLQRILSSLRLYFACKPSKYNKITSSFALVFIFNRESSKYKVESKGDNSIFSFFIAFLLLLYSLSCVRLFVTPWTASHQASLSFTISWSLLKLMSIVSMIPSNRLILCHHFLLLPSIFPSIRVFSNELALCIKWPKYWSFSFSINPSNECSGLISFRIDWFALLAVQGTLKSLLSTTVQKH